VQDWFIDGENRPLCDFIAIMARVHHDAFRVEGKDELMTALHIWIGELDYDLHIPLYAPPVLQPKILLNIYGGKEEDKALLSSCPYNIGDILMIADISGSTNTTIQLDVEGHVATEEVPRVEPTSSYVIGVVIDRTIVVSSSPSSTAVSTPSSTTTMESSSHVICRVHFDQWRSTLEEWIHVDSDRLRGLTNEERATLGVSLPHPHETLYQRLSWFHEPESIKMRQEVDDLLVTKRAKLCDRLLIISSLPRVLALLIASLVF
jgi:hypothetical protein